MTEINNPEQSPKPEDFPKDLSSTTRFAGISSRPLAESSQYVAPESPISGFVWFGIGALVGALFVASLSWAVLQHRMAEDEFGRLNNHMVRQMPNTWSDGITEASPKSEFICQEMMGEGSGMIGQGMGGVIGDSSGFELPTPGMMGGAASSVTGMTGGIASGNTGIMEGHSEEPGMVSSSHPGQVILCANDSMGILFENRDPGIYAKNTRLGG